MHVAELLPASVHAAELLPVCKSYLVVGCVDMFGGDVGIRLDVVGVKHAQDYPADGLGTQL